jgi:hypothetical protein
LGHLKMLMSFGDQTADGNLLRHGQRQNRHHR